MNVVKVIRIRHDVQDDTRCSCGPILLLNEQKELMGVAHQDAIGRWLGVSAYPVWRFNDDGEVYVAAAQSIWGIQSDGYATN